MIKSVHVLAGHFDSRDVACQYTEARWEPEPPDSATDEEYAAWENRNPSWPLRADLGIYLDSDFIETIDGDDRYEYLQRMLLDPDALDYIKTMAGTTSNILVLIFDEALGDFGGQIGSTSVLKYCGQHECDLDRI